MAAPAPGVAEGAKDTRRSAFPISDIAMAIRRTRKGRRITLAPLIMEKMVIFYVMMSLTHNDLLSA